MIINPKPSLATSLMLFSLAVVLVSSAARAQSPDIRPMLKQIANGWTAEAKKALPDLLIDHPSDPAVLFLHASLVEEPGRAVPLFDRIVEAHAKSEWADDALLRIVMWAAQRRDTTRARRSLALFRDAYPNSDLLLVAADVVRLHVGLPLATERKTPVAANSAASTAKDAAPAKISTATPAPADDSALPKSFGIQVGSYSTKKQADDMAAAFRKRRMKASTNSKIVGKTTNYTIMVGDYATEAAAQPDVATVRSICKCKAFVVAK